MNERVTLIEFDSLEQAIARREGGAYLAAFAKLRNSYTGCSYYSKRHRRDILSGFLADRIQDYTAQVS
jgi:hypothetical protein